MIAFVALAWTVAVAVAVPAVWLAIECFAASRRRRLPPRARRPRPRCTVIVPAHDEELTLPACLRSLVTELAPGDRVLVVADNCTDRTAAIARAAGVDVIERHDERRGKGYALAAAVAHLQQHDPPGVIVIVDADCRVEPGAVDALARIAHATARPVQGVSRMEVPPGAGPRLRLLALAARIKNEIRPQGAAALGFAAPLLGYGVALPWYLAHLLERQPGSIVEDLELTVEAAEAGVAPVYCAQAQVTNRFPASADALRTQRRRWEHGHLACLVRRGLPLLARGIAHRDRGRIGVALDLLVPPLSLLAAGVVAATSIGALAWFAVGSAGPLVIAIAAAASLVSAVAAAWRCAGGSRVCSPADLLRVPAFLMWKVPLYAQLLFHRERQWIRTRRS